MDFTSSLNPDQRKACEHFQGPILVLAGAGSGKTRVLTHRIAHLIENHGIDPSNILAVTFTNKAAQEMRHRVERLIGPRAKAVWLSTFHSACLRILRRHAEILDYKKDFVVYDDTDQKTLIKQILADLNFSEKTMHPNTVSAAINSAKNDLTSAEIYMSQPLNFIQERIAEVYVEYQKRLKANQAMDYGDLIMQAVRLLEKSKDTARLYRDVFRFVMVDEYQDTNPAQYHFLSLLFDPSDAEKNIFVVGDEDQSIYGWRGADLKILMRFEKDFPGAVLQRLEQNYRSTQVILSASNELVKNNEERKGKTLWTERKGGDLVVYATALDEHGEGDFIAKTLKSLKAEGKIKGYSDVAVFYRMNSQSRVLEEELRRMSIPYKIIGGTKFYDRMEIKDALAYLRVFVNPADSIGFLRIINKPARGIGKTTIEELVKFADAEGIPLFEALGRLADISALSTAGKKNLLKVQDMFSELRKQYGVLSVSQFAHEVLKASGYLKALDDEASVEAQSRTDNLHELLADLEEYEEKFVPHDEVSQPTLGDYLDRVALVEGIEDFDPEEGVVSLMTLHLAKGLEFPCVFMTGMEEGLFPHSRSLDEDRLEEERRLCYVGMTRAMDRLYLTNAYRRRFWGAENINIQSRFCDEIPVQYIERKTVYGQDDDRQSHSYLDRGQGAYLDRGTSSDGGRGREEVISYDGEEGPEYRVGMRVRHEQFGEGVVRATEGFDQNAKVVVQFNRVGAKKLLIRVANLEVVR